MSSPISILAKAKEVKWFPWPHVVIQNALPGPLYDELLRERIGWKDIIGLTGKPATNNTRYDIPAAKVITGVASMTPAWRDFITYHVSPMFWRDLMRVFGEVIKTVHPMLAIDQPVGVRYLDRAPWVMDCQMGINSPALEESRVVGPHIDNPAALFAGLLYMGENKGEGGDLILYQWKNGPIYKEEGQGHRVPDEAVTEIARVPFQHNTFVGFINYRMAVHGVSPRKSEEPRLLTNFLVDSTKGKIFNKYG